MTEKKKLKILIADDEAHIRLLLKTAMISMNVEVVDEAKDGNEAVEFFIKRKPDIMLLDINMPFKSGIEVLNEIKIKFPDAFIIMMTSLADSQTVQNCLESGAASYILKDTPIAEMKKIIVEAWTDHIKNKG